MQASPTVVAEKIKLQSENYILKTMEPADAELDWGRWTANPTTARMLNAQPRVMSVMERLEYIKAFDSFTSHLLGIWSKASGALVGFWSVHVEHERKEFLINVLVGSADQRDNGAVKETRHLLYQHFFETLDMQAVCCSVSAQNQQMIDWLAKLRWTRVGVVRKPAASGNGAVEIYAFRLPRETWRTRTIPE